MTAGNASGRNDGASALILMDAELAASQGIRPLAKIRGIAAAGVGSLIGLRKSRTMAVIGLVASFALLVFGALGAVWFDSGQTALRPSLHLVASLIISGLAVFSGIFWLRRCSGPRTFRFPPALPPVFRNTPSVSKTVYSQQA